MIGCIGLFGLASYSAIQRTKEIGIRKVLGSPMTSVFVLLIKDYIKLIILANIIGVPLVYFMMNRWLETFAYHSSISAFVFLIAGAAVLMVAVMTVSFQILQGCSLKSGGRFAL